MIRTRLAVEMKGAMVILDEAHNIEDVSREAASVDVDVSEFERMLSVPSESSPASMLTPPRCN